jgi:hypothetical protein
VFRDSFSPLAERRSRSIRGFNDGRKGFMGALPSVGEIGAVAKVPLQHGRGIETTLSHTEQRV